MLCKKCGANIEENSKFCGYCGNQVERMMEPQSVGTNSDFLKENDVGLEQTIEMIPVNQKAVTSSVEQSSLNPTSFNSNVVSNVNEQTNQSINSQISVDTNVVQNSVNSNNKKNNKWIFVIGGILLAAIAIVVLVFALMKSSNNDILVLEKAINNLSKQGENSATVDADLSLATSTGESFAFSLTVKTEKKNDDKVDMMMTLNKSLFFDEMNVYASIEQNEMTMYMESSLIDMMGMTSSVEPTWIYYTMSLDEIIEEDNTAAETNINVNLQELLDKEHFMYVDEVGNLKHYILVIDQELIDKIIEKISVMEDGTIKDTLNFMETLEKAMKIDFYITETNELSRIELNLSEYLEGVEDISELVFSMSFRDLNSTKVEIPSEAKNSIIDLETYMMTNSSESEFDHDYESNYDYEYDYSWDQENYYDDSTVDVQL